MLPPHRHSQDGDAPIRATDNDAALARLSAVQKGYFDDPFITYLVPRAHLQPPRPPLINVGTFVRSQAIDNLVDQWLSFSEAGNRPCQIVSLGAGSDTRFWRIANGPHKDILAAYVEVDFPEVTTKKAMVIRKNLSEALGSPSDIHIIHGGTGVRSPKYHLIPADLRLPPSEKLEHLLFSPNSNSSSTEDKPILSTSLPTLLLFECVLVYVSPSQSSRLLGWFVDKFSKSESIDGILGCIVYEMFGLNDAFGRVMVNNLKARNVFLPGAEPYPTIERVPARFLETGFTAAHALTLRDIRREYVPRTELERISKLEMLDEMEELELVLEHYAISWGLFLSNASSAKIWDEWGLKKIN